MFFPKSVGLSFNKNDLIISKASQKLLKCAFEGVVVKDFLVKDTLELKLIIHEQEYNNKEIVLSWPREKTIVREIELPASSINELKESISYQLDSFILFPEEEVYYDIYPSISSEYGERAFIFAIKKEDIDSILNKLDSLNLTPGQIVISPLSFIPFINQNKTVIIDKDNDDYYSYNLYTDSSLVNTSLIRNEAILKERIAEDKPDRLILLDENCGDNIDISNDDVTVELWNKDKESMGAAINGVTEYLKGFNVLKTKRRKYIPQLVLTCVLSLLIIAFAVIVPGVVKHKKIKTVNAIEARLQELLPEVTAASKFKEDVESILETIGKVKKIMDPNSLRIDLLEELTRVLPDDTWIKQMSFKKDYFEIEGIGMSGSNVLAILENTPKFTHVRFASPVTKDRDGKEKFKIKGNTGEL